MHEGLLSYLQYGDVISLCGWAMLEKLLVKSFEWIKDTSHLNEDFIKTIMKKVMKDIFLKLLFKILKKYINLVLICHFYQKN